MCASYWNLLSESMRARRYVLIYKPLELSPLECKVHRRLLKAQPFVVRFVDRDKLVCPLELSVDCNGALFSFLIFITGDLARVEFSLCDIIVLRQYIVN